MQVSLRTIASSLALPWNSLRGNRPLLLDPATAKPKRRQSALHPVTAMMSCRFEPVTEPTSGVVVAVADMLILAEDVFTFEEDHDMVRRPATGANGGTSYDWEGMNVALIQRIHERGLPATQAELIAEMQGWFADQSDGMKMPDSRSIRRRITPIWRALRKEDA